MGKKSQKIGAAGEDLATGVLRIRGLHMVQKIGTPVRISPAGQRGAYFVRWGERVAGDRRGVLSNGISVLVEVKTITDGNLAYSAFKEHQFNDLDEHCSIGDAVSLVVWVHSSGVYVMDWQMIHMLINQPRQSITPEQGAKYDIPDLDFEFVKRFR